MLYRQSASARTWIFQADPGYALRTEIPCHTTDEWTLYRYFRGPNSVRYYDRVLLWQAREKAGIYGTGVIVEGPFACSRLTADENASSEVGVVIRCDGLLERPILKSELEGDRFLAGLSVLRMPQETVFPVTVDEVRHLEPRLSHLHPLRPDARPFQCGGRHTML